MAKKEWSDRAPELPPAPARPFRGSEGSPMLRSKVNSVMLVVLFIGGRGLFPSNIFSFLLSLSLSLSLLVLQQLGGGDDIERESEDL